VTVDAENPACGDMLRLRRALRTTAWRRRLSDARLHCFDRRRLRADRMDDRESREELRALTPAMVEELLDGLQPASQHAAVLCVDAAKNSRREGVGQFHSFYEPRWGGRPRPQPGPWPGLECS